MHLSPKACLTLCLLLINLALLSFAAVIWQQRAQTPPLIQGVLLPQARTIAPFSLLDHQHQPFTERELLGRWHLVSYGFTACPDICPTTLAQLARFAKMLERQGHHDLRLLFYSVDHRRDTSAVLASYLPFFNADFVGLTHLDHSANPHLPFEQGLGINAQLSPADGQIDSEAGNAYQVSHGITLLLLNPEGQFQAVFTPNLDSAGASHFDAHQILKDYLQIRDYLG
jgi:protein SCO1/2